MVNHETVVVPFFSGNLAQGGGDQFGFFPGIGKNQTFFLFGGGIHKGVCAIQYQIPFFFRLVGKKVLHGKPPFQGGVFHFRNRGFIGCSLPQPICHCPGISHRGGQADSPGTMPHKAGDAFHDTPGLFSPILPRKSVNFINDNIGQMGKDPGNIVGSMQQHAFQRFGGNLQDSPGIFQKFFFGAGRHIAMPMKNGYAAFEKQGIQTGKLIVNQRFERGDV